MPVWKTTARVHASRVDQAFAQAFSFPFGETLMATTDLKGRITYCNPALVHVGGYAQAELLGQPLAAAYHPDMPAEALADMWQTVQQGKPWSGLLKTRRKDGRHCWAQTRVTPLLAGARQLGYMLVYTQARQEHIVQAERQTRPMRCGQPGQPGQHLRLVGP